MMDRPGEATEPRGPRASGAARPSRGRSGRRAVLAVWLALLVVGSVALVPVAGAAVGDDGAFPSHKDKHKDGDDSSPSDGAPGQNKDDGSDGDTTNTTDDTSTTGLKVGHMTENSTDDTTSPGGSSEAPGQTKEEDTTDGSSSDGTVTSGSDTSSTDSSTSTTGSGSSDDSSTSTSDAGSSDDDVSVGTASGTTSGGDEVDLTVDSQDDDGTATEDGTVTLSRFTVSSSDDDVDEVSLTFEVSKERLLLADSDPESVRLYAFVDGEWVVVDTRTIGETATHYVFAADSPYVSEFAVGAIGPQYDLWSVDLQGETARVGEEVVVRARFSNVGRGDGVYDVSLAADGRSVLARQHTIAGGGTRQATLVWRPAEAGTYTLSVNGVPAGTVEVAPAPSSDPAFGTLAYARWLGQTAMGSVLEWAEASGRYVVVGAVPLSVAALLE